jgi:hypothetical protein
MRDLFSQYDPDAPAQLHSPTSQAAAADVQPRAATLRRAVLDWLASRGETGGTDEEGIEATGIGPSTYRPRRIELWLGGFVRDSGQVRLTRSNRRATVWVATGRA